MQLAWKITFKSASASPLIIMSTYFEVLAFMYIGIDPLFSIILSLAVVGMMEYIFQVVAKLFKEKRILLASGLLIVWLIFFGVSIAGNIYSIWDIMDKAKNKREQTAVKNINESKEIELLDIQIELLADKLKGFQDDYKNPKNNAYVKKVYITPELNKAENDLDKKIEERKKIVESEKESTQKKEIGVDNTGDINPILKIIIAIVLAIIVDIGGCLIIMFSWILKKQDTENKTIVAVKENPIIENIKPENTVNKIRQDVQDFTTRLNKPLTWLDKVTRFYDYLVNDFYAPLYGRTSKQFLESGLSIADYNTIRSRAISLGYLKSERKNTWFGAFWDFEKDTNIRELFIKGMCNENS